jgi:hypothetical protein
MGHDVARTLHGETRVTLVPSGSGRAPVLVVRESDRARGRLSLAHDASLLAAGFLQQPIPTTPNPTDRGHEPRVLLLVPTERVGDTGRVRTTIRTSAPLTNTNTRGALCPRCGGAPVVVGGHFSASTASASSSPINQPHALRSQPMGAMSPVYS